MKKRIFTALALLFAVIMSSGCSMNLSLDNLLSPPKLTDEQNAIYQALLNSKGSDVSLKYPKSGDYRSAFVIYNLDDEPTDEAIVFYESTGISEETNLRINFLDQKDGEWVSVYDVPALGTEVERVIFERLSGDTELSIIIGYSVLNQSDKAVSVLKYTDSTPVEIFRGSYSFMDLFDIDYDGQRELFIINYDKALAYATASTFAWIDGVFTTTSILDLDPSATEYVSVKLGNSSGGTAVFVDYYKGDNTYGTEVLICRGAVLVKAVGSDYIVRRSNAYTPSVNSRDIDDDGIIEVPATTVLPGYENLSKPEQLNAVTWNAAEESGGFRRKYTTYLSTRKDFIFFMPSRWEGMVTVTQSTDGSEVTIWKAGELNSLNQQLLTIKAAAKSDKSAFDSAEYTRFEFDAESEYDYYVKRGSVYNSLTLTDDELNDSLRFIDSSGTVIKGSIKAAE